MNTNTFLMKCVFFNYVFIYFYTLFRFFECLSDYNNASSTKQNKANKQTKNHVFQTEKVEAKAMAFVHLLLMYFTKFN